MESSNGALINSTAIIIEKNWKKSKADVII
jgi:hypothetical protein